MRIEVCTTNVAQARVIYDLLPEPYRHNAFVIVKSQFDCGVLLTGTGGVVPLEVKQIAAWVLTDSSY